MAEAEFKHPKYSTNDALKSIVVNRAEHKVLRLEYPDGVIVVFDEKPEQITLTSNYAYFLDVGNVVTPNLSKSNEYFVDVI